MKQLKASKKRPEQPTVSKKRSETTYKEQETTWSDLQRTDFNFMDSPLFEK